jgi:TolB-like protein/Tfp pilus assembly protein PilF
MARELGVEVDCLIAEEPDPDAMGAWTLTGEWTGFYVGTDRFGQPYVIEESTNLVQEADRVEGSAEIEIREGVMRDTFVDSFVTNNVFSGQTKSEQWPYPLDSASFVMSGIRNFTRLDGYMTWYDIDTESPDFSRYTLIKRNSPQFAAEIADARAMFENEIKLMRLRRLLETGYGFENAVDLVKAVKVSTVAYGTESGADAATEDKATQLPVVNRADPTDQTVIAVSSLTVLDSDPSQKYYADGLIDDIATDLSFVSGLNVLPRSSFPSGAPVDAETALRRGASHVLSGSLQRLDNRLRVNAQLVETAGGKIIWAKRYQHQADDVFKAHDEISQDVAAALSLKLADAPTAISTRNVIDPHAYELFLKARSLYLRGIYTHSLRSAEALLMRAVDIDPGFARAHAQISICRSYLVLSNAQSTSSRSNPDDGLSAALRALEIDPCLPLGKAARGLVHYAAGDFDAAEQDFRASIERDPQLFEAHFFLARDLRLQGDRVGAAEFFARASALRPEDFRATGLLAEELQALGKDNEARSMFQSSLASVERELETHPDNAGALAFGAAIQCDLGYFERAVSWSEWALAIAPDDCLVHYNIARVHAISGDPKMALTQLQNAFKMPPAQRRRLALWMKFDEDFNDLASEQQFRDLLL